MPPAKRRSQNDSECSPAQCQLSIDALEFSLNKLNAIVEKMDERLDAHAERIATQEAHNRDTNRELKKLDVSLRHGTDSIREEITRHSQLCPGREYALRKIKKASHAPAPIAPHREQEDTGVFLLDKEFKAIAMKALDERGKGFSIPKWVIYIGVIIGVAVAAGAYAIGKLFSDG